MIVGTVDNDGVPIVLLEIGDIKQAAIVDSGFNGDLELPDYLRTAVSPIFVNRARSVLAGGQSIEEDVFTVIIPFDGRMVEAEATFSPDLLGAIGTRLLRDYRLVIDFVEKTVILSRADESST